MSAPEEKETTICDCNGRPDSCGVCPYCGKLSPLFEAQNRIAELVEALKQIVSEYDYAQDTETSDHATLLAYADAIGNMQYIAREAIKKVGK